MRTAFIEQLIKEREKNEKIFLIVGDLGYNVVNTFAERFPSSYLNAGIAEQNMMGVAAGLASENFIVYVYSIGNFPTLRCIEQIRNDVSYNNLNVRIVSVGAGFAYGSLGASHHTTEDIGIMRTLPNFVIASPGDPIEAMSITSLSVRHNGPMYLRLGKAGEGIIHDDSEHQILIHEHVQIGDVLPVLQNYNTKAVLATGSILKALKDRILRDSLDLDLYSVPFVKPIKHEYIKMLCQHYDEFITVEEHQESCGLNSAILEIICDLYNEGAIHNFPKIRRLAVKDKFFYTVGSQSCLRTKAGLDI